MKPLDVILRLVECSELYDRSAAEALRNGMDPAIVHRMHQRANACTHAACLLLSTITAPRQVTRTGDKTLQ